MRLAAPSDRSVLDSLAMLGSEPDSRRRMAALLAATERWSGAELERHQVLRLGRLLAHARVSVPRYAGLPDVPAEHWTLERFRELPRLTREAVRDDAESLLSRAIPPAHRIVREANSSGSTGKHVTVQIDAVSAAVCDALALRDHRWHGRDLTGKAAAIRAIRADGEASHGGRPLRWAPSKQSGPLAQLDIHTPAREQLEWLVREAPAYLSTYANNAAALVAEAERTGLGLPTLRELGTFGESLPPDLRESCRRVLGIPVVDAYSTSELGYVALQCPEHEQYHVQSEHLLVEVLRPDGSPCRAGETGCVVATTLHAFAMPLVRYELGDFATVGSACPCGRGLPVIERILGRSRNMLRLPNGDVLWPRYGSIVLGKLFPLRQFRLVQTTLTTLVLELVPTRTLRPDEERRLRELVLQTVRFPFALELVYRDGIARAASGKFEDFVCEIEEG